jgi:serine protease Do
MDLVQRVLPMLKQEGKVVRAYVGIYVDALPPDRAKKLGLDHAHGALVKSVIPGGPAARAGLRAGDVILSFGGREIESARELPWIASLAGIDREVPVEVWRNGKARTFQVQTKRMPE